METKPLDDKGPNGPNRTGSGTNHGTGGTQGGISPQVPRDPNSGAGPYSS